MKLIQLNEIQEGSSLGIDIDENSFIVVRHKEQIHVYKNSCPHLGLPLEFMPNQFLTHDKSLIQCSSHGALFEHGTGICISGPCQGQSLKVIPFTVQEGWITVS